MGHIYVFNLLPSRELTLLHFTQISSTIFESLNNDDSKESDKNNSNKSERQKEKEQQ